MVHCRLPTFVMIALAVFSAGAGQGLAAQPGHAPGGDAVQPVPSSNSHPYKVAIRAVENYQSCGVRARPTLALELAAELRSLEAAAVAKGLGPVLERLRREYQEWMSMVDIMACAGGPAGALAEARGAVATFRAWVAAQPRAARAGAGRTFAERAAPHSYKSALGAVGNYRSCGVRARAATGNALAAELRSIEARAVAKGLGPLLERLREDYRHQLSVSSMMACGGGPAAALTGAQRSLADFRAWVARQPGR